MQHSCNKKMSRRNTPTTNAVLQVLKQSKVALSHDMLSEELENGVDRTTIYRILNRFEEDGLVHKVICDDGKQYFAYCSDCEKEDHSHDHFHFRCTNCGKVECLENEIKVDLPESYRPTVFNGVITGICDECV